MNLLKSAGIRWLLAGALAIALFVAGYLIGGGGTPSTAPHDHASGAPAATEWTCSMHPQIRSPEAGKCPICGMDLIPVTAAADDTGSRELRLSAAARKLAEIETSPVERRAVTREVRMVGTVDYDETRQATITAWVGGRLDRLFVDYTGIAVKEGDHMVWMYSPAILSAQEELIQAGKALLAVTDPNLPLVRQAAVATRDAVRDKLRLWGLTDDQIAEIEQRGTASDHIQINAPTSGIVIEKEAVEGMYVETGMPIYRIADLTQVWVRLDAYESDLAWLRYGQDVTFTTETFPGETFHGRIAFIDPALTLDTRTVKVRLNVPNADGRLKPGMFVRAVVGSQLDADGRAIAPDLAGKWISPMHPEIVRDEPGPCPVCGMPLVKAEELGFRSPAANAEPPLVIPASAPLVTGKRAIVFVQNPGDSARFEGREIVLGPRAGDWYLVRAGLTAGELVVTSGNFKLDSALQLLAKPSMMSPAEPADDQAAQAPAATPDFVRQLGPVFETALDLSKVLADDQFAPALAAADLLADRLGAVSTDRLDTDFVAFWNRLAGPAREEAASLAGAADLAAARRHFGPLSRQLIAIGRQLGTGLDRTIRIAHCPMAFDNRGGDWLQVGDDIANPYFGAEMYGCGEFTGKLEPAPARSTGEHLDHE